MRSFSAHACFWLLLVVGCADSAFHAAARSNTAQAWRAFLQQHPTDERVDEARSSLAQLDFAQAQSIHSVVAYKRFLEEHPNSDEAPKAKSLLEGLRFNAAMEAGTAQALRGFLRENPQGAHRAEAEKRLESLELADVAAGGDVAQLRSRIALAPDDPRMEAARLQLDDQVFEEAKTAQGLLAYLEDFPAGKHRDEARDQLFLRRLEGLLVSLELGEARQLVGSAGLAANIKESALKRVRAAEQKAALSAAASKGFRLALPDHSRRGIDDLIESLKASDPLDRWQAAEELGSHLSVRTLDPLLEALRDSRYPLVRQRSFDSLARVLKGLPHSVAEYEVATRLAKIPEDSTDAQQRLTRAVLLDVVGELERAAQAYQGAWNAEVPDPVLLRRWAFLRLERGQLFSAAVAARQLALWAGAVAERSVVVDAPNPLAVSRELCAAREAARSVEAVLGQVTGEKTEFPGDVEAFLVKARDVRRLSEAKLRDAELELMQRLPLARTCDDDGQVRERLQAGVAQRLLTLRALAKKRPQGFGLLLTRVVEHDPEPQVRELARALSAN